MRLTDQEIHALGQPHQPYKGRTTHCAECEHRWPCPTSLLCNELLARRNGCVTIEEWTFSEGLTLTATRTTSGDWCASVNAEVLAGGILMVRRGFGDTPNAAVENLAAVVAGQRIVVNAYSDDRREFNAPERFLP